MKKSIIIFHPNLLQTDNTERPKIGSKCKVADEYQYFFVIVERIDGELITGRIDNIVYNVDYKFGDKVMFNISNVINS